MSTEMVEVIKDLGKALVKRDETNSKFMSNFENQYKLQQVGALNLKEPLDNIKLEIEKLRQRPVQQLPNFNGENMDFDDWEDSIEQVIICNEWTFKLLMDYLPISLQGSAKEAFIHLNPNDKETKQKMFMGMRSKIAPESKEKNMKLFEKAEKHPGESMAIFMDRCRTYLKRSGHNIWSNVIMGWLEMKLKNNLGQLEQKIVSLKIQDGDDLKAAVETADMLLNCNDEKVNVAEVKNIKLDMSTVEQNNCILTNELKSREHRGGPCGKCGTFGHKKKNCPEKKK